MAGRSTRNWAVAALLLVAAAGGLFAAVRARMPVGSDPEQIRALLDRGESAAERREIGGVMRFVSPEYRDGSGFTRDSLRLLVGRALRDAQSVDVSTPERSVNIQVGPDGQHATLACDVSVRLAERGGGNVARDAHLTFRLSKEPVRIFGVFPTQEWRVIRADGYGALGDLSD
jgi:hypothetical protein